MVPPLRSIAAASAVALALALGPAACGSGQSKEEKAMNQVCDARTDIKKQIDELSGLTPTTATVDGIKNNLSAIQKDMSQIKDAEPQLNSQRKQQVESAAQAFQSEVTATVKNLGSSLSLSAAQSQVQSAAQALAKSFQQSLAPIDCG